MFDRVVNELNCNQISYRIVDLYEEDDNDYVLLVIEKELVVALEVNYAGKTVSFSRLCQSKKSILFPFFLSGSRKINSHNSHEKHK